MTKSVTATIFDSWKAEESLMLMLQLQFRMESRSKKKSLLMIYYTWIQFAMGENYSTSVMLLKCFSDRRYVRDQMKTGGA
jgi:hypothetical protein